MSGYVRGDEVAGYCVYWRGRGRRFDTLASAVAYADQILTQTGFIVAIERIK